MAPSRNDREAARPAPQRGADTLVTAPRRFGADSRAVLLAGVAGACLLGASAGAWVRPEAADLKARVPAHTPQRAAVAMTQTPQVQIVMDETLVLPHRPPMEVLPDWAVRPPPAPPLVIPAREDPPARLVQAEARHEPVKAKADKAALAKPAKVKSAKATPTGAERPKAAKPKTVVIAKAAPKTSKVAKVKPEKAAVAMLDKAKAAVKEKPLALAKAKPAAPAAKAPARLAVAEPPAPPRLEAPTKPAKAPPKATAKAQPQLVRSAPNPWAAEDRRLERAYRRAAEAGVPEWRLARQQARWRQARDAAAREAPWEVPRVYDARIAELDDLAGEAAIEWE